jgi:hypothetical protein
LPAGWYGKEDAWVGGIQGLEGVVSRVSRVVGLTGMIVAGLVAVLFVADLAAGFPFGRLSIPVDIGFIVAGVILAYLGWSIMDRPRATR